MTATTIFVFIATIIFLFLFIIWNGKSMMNIILKTTFFLMSVYGVVVSLAALGIVTSSTVRLF